MRTPFPSFILAGLLLILCVLLAGCQSKEAGVVGSKAFTESVILAEIAVGLGETAGQTLQHRQQIGGTRLMWDALRAGEIDVYPEYTGTIRLEILAGQRIDSDEELQQRLAEEGIVMSPSLGFNNSYALGMKRSKAEELGIRSITDLQQHPQLALGFSNEFLERSDGWPGLKQVYDLPQQNVRGLEHTLAYQALNNGGLDVIDVYTTDPQIPQFDLLLLEDDRNYFPRYEAVLLYRQDYADQHPDVIEAWQRLTGQISEQTMSQFNQQVQIEGHSEQEAAAEFLRQSLGVEMQVTTQSLIQRLSRTTRQHLWLVGVSLLAAILVAVPLGVVAYRYPLAGQFILGFAEVIQTIPGLALLVLIGIVFVKCGLRMISPWPAIVALFLYSLLPILRNTLAGLTNIPPSLRESAAALGMTGWTQLWRIELPLASPLILAGIKTTAVINIGYAALGGLIGAGGYGQPIMGGLRLNNTALMLEGAIPAALLALLVKFLLTASEAWIIPKGLRLHQEN